MVDNDNAYAPAWGTPVASDEINGVRYPVFKLAFGPQNSATVADSDNPIPVEIMTKTLQIAGLSIPIRSTDTLVVLNNWPGEVSKSYGLVETGDSGGDTNYQVPAQKKLRLLGYRATSSMTGWELAHSDASVSVDGIANGSVSNLTIIASWDSIADSNRAIVEGVFSANKFITAGLYPIVQASAGLINAGNPVTLYALLEDA